MLGECSRLTFNFSPDSVNTWSIQLLYTSMMFFKVRDYIGLLVRNFLENRIIRIHCFSDNDIKNNIRMKKSSFEEMLLKYKLLKT